MTGETFVQKYEFCALQNSMGWTLPGGNFTASKDRPVISVMDFKSQIYCQTISVGVSTVEEIVNMTRIVLKIRLFTDDDCPNEKTSSFSCEDPNVLVRQHRIIFIFPFAAWSPCSTSIPESCPSAHYLLMNYLLMKIELMLLLQVEHKFVTNFYLLNVNPSKFINIHLSCLFDYSLLFITYQSSFSLFIYWFIKSWKTWTSENSDVQWYSARNSHRAYRSMDTQRHISLIILQQLLFVRDSLHIHSLQREDLFMTPDRVLCSDNSINITITLCAITLQMFVPLS